MKFATAFWAGLSGRSYSDYAYQESVITDGVAQGLARVLEQLEQTAAAIAPAAPPARPTVDQLSPKRRADYERNLAVLAAKRDDVQKVEAYLQRVGVKGDPELLDRALGYYARFLGGFGHDQMVSDLYLYENEVQEHLGWLSNWAEQYLRGEHALPAAAVLDKIQGVFVAILARINPEIGIQFENAWRVNTPDIYAEWKGLPSVASGNALRPKSLDDVVGQDRVREQVRLLVDAAKRRGETLDHLLLAGPPGLGKTTLALILANELGVRLHTTSGPTLTKVSELASLLGELSAGDLLLIDEIHRLPKQVSEALYLAVEDFRIDVKTDDGGVERRVLPAFTLVGATTHAGLIPAPLRDRFGYTGQLEPYADVDLTAIVMSSASKLGYPVTAETAAVIASRSRGTPRVANALLRRVRDYAQGRDVEPTPQVAADALDLFEIDSLGLDRLDRDVLSALDRLGGGPVGISTLAAATGQTEESVEAAESYLVRIGFVDRSPRGRTLTESGRAHLTQ